jgi:Cu/Ag efflux pump CusA
MNLVSWALRRPVTIVVLVLATVLAGLLAIQRMPRDIFPDLGVPVLCRSAIRRHGPGPMEGFLVNYYEFSYITGIEHVDPSRSRVRH